jgi:hypothetical protein
MMCYAAAACCIIVLLHAVLLLALTIRGIVLLRLPRSSDQQGT